MILLKIKEIKFSGSLFYRPQVNLGLLKEKREIYCLNLTEQRLISKNNYTCFYCFKHDFIDRVKLNSHDIEKVIEGELHHLDRNKFRYSSGSYTEDLYSESPYLKSHKHDQYYNEWVVIKENNIEMSPYIRYLDLEFGRIFYWEVGIENKTIL